MSRAGADALRSLPAIGLEELLATSGLMTRVDRKYALDPAAAGLLVDLAPPGSRVLEIDGTREFGYTTTYLDTPQLLTYHLAAYRRRRRFKVRTRTYDTNGLTYLEVKTRAGERTVKTRLEGTHTRGGRLTPGGAAFVAGALGDAGIDVEPVTGLAAALTVRYDRSTLHLADDGARVTLDRALRWERDGEVLHRPGLVVVETKSTGRVSTLDRLLWSLGHRPDRVSKYATGLAALDPDLAANRWTRVLRTHF